ncbi:MAG: sigma-54-dependent Fis family transcriptional regulator [Deltaproteobacteria bacterium]|nr:sigma-54-dependent Fis family transcriptional regulator [Deltaproteobacteria bacterium]
MGGARYNLSLYVLIPVIFAGTSTLAGVLVYQFMKASGKGVTTIGDLFTGWFFVIIIATLLCGLLITWFLLKPMRTFFKEAEQLPLLADALHEWKNRDANELDQFTMMLREVKKVLSRMEARELFPDIIGQSSILRGLFSQILKVAKTDTTVLITGESGTGKELVATSIFNHSLRRDKPFIKLNCVAIPEGLLESELFGHEKGAFTGATARKIGKFELAEGGTILLDEIGDMPLDTQAKILRVLQECEFERVGGTRPIKVNVRFIASTNKDLKKMVEEGSFREDLYYRLNVFNLALPPLRERQEDIPLLVSHFLETSPIPARISSTALQVLMNYPWPGNIRELRNTVERAAVMADDGSVEVTDIPQNILTAAGMQGISAHPSQHRSKESEDIQAHSMSIDERLENLEKKLISEALLSAGGVQTKAAEALGIKERSLWHRIKKYNIDVNAMKAHQ